MILVNEKYPAVRPDEAIRYLESLGVSTSRIERVANKLVAKRGLTPPFSYLLMFREHVLDMEIKDVATNFASSIRVQNSDQTGTLMRGLQVIGVEDLTSTIDPQPNDVMLVTFTDLRYFLHFGYVDQNYNILDRAGDLINSTGKDNGDDTYQLYTWKEVIEALWERRPTGIDCELSFGYSEILNNDDTTTKEALKNPENLYLQGLDVATALKEVFDLINHTIAFDFENSIAYVISQRSFTEDIGNFDLLTAYGDLARAGRIYYSTNDSNLLGALIPEKYYVAFPKRRYRPEDVPDIDETIFPEDRTDADAYHFEEVITTDVLDEYAGEDPFIKDLRAKFTNPLSGSKQVIHYPYEALYDFDGEVKVREDDDTEALPDLNKIVMREIWRAYTSCFLSSMKIIGFTNNLWTGKSLGRIEFQLFSTAEMTEISLTEEPDTSTLPQRYATYLASLRLEREKARQISNLLDKNRLHKEYANLNFVRLTEALTEGSHATAKVLLYKGDEEDTLEVPTAANITSGLWEESTREFEVYSTKGASDDDIGLVFFDREIQEYVFIPLSAIGVYVGKTAGTLSERSGLQMGSGTVTRHKSNNTGLLSSESISDTVYNWGSSAVEADTWVSYAQFGPVKVLLSVDCPTNQEITFDQD